VPHKCIFQQALLVVPQIIAHKDLGLAPARLRGRKCIFQQAVQSGQQGRLVRTVTTENDQHTRDRHHIHATTGMLLYLCSRGNPERGVKNGQEFLLVFLIFLFFCVFHRFLENRVTGSETSSLEQIGLQRYS
jgi:hypothetical protein